MASQKTVLLAILLWQFLTVPVPSGPGATLGLPAMVKTTNMTMSTSISSEDVGDSEYAETTEVPRKNLTCWKCRTQTDCQKPLDKCENAIKCFKYWNKNAYGVPSWERGCLYNTPTHQLFHMWCRFNGPRHDRFWEDDDGGMVMDCCDEGDLCNNGTITGLPSKPREPKLEDDTTTIPIYVWICIACLVVVVVFVAVTLLCFYTRKKSFSGITTPSFLHQDKSDNAKDPNSDVEHGSRSLRSKDAESPQKNTENRFPSVDGDIKMGELIGGGRSMVRKAVLNKREKVAVKIFLGLDYSYFEVEAEIYSLLKPIQHDNILRFYGTKVVGMFERWIVTEYHKNGNLYEYLKRQTVSVEEAVKLAHSLARGLAGLHDAGIAHRDLKSMNVLVSANKTCVLCDFEFSLILKPDLTLGKLRSNWTDVGTNRYMAPELLNKSINAENFDAFKCADMYAFALVIWEVTQRIEAEDVKAPKYQLPYFDVIIQRAPSKEQMRQVVCDSRCRPKFADAWISHAIVGPMITYIMQCWDADPSKRKTATQTEAFLRDRYSKT